MIRAYVPASGVFVESISNAELRDSFGIVLLGETLEKSGSTVRPA